MPDDACVLAWSVEGGGEDEVGDACLDAFVRAVEEVHVERAAFLADGFEALYLYVLGGGAELLGAEAHGQADGVVAGEECAVEHDGLCLVLENLQVQRRGAGIDVLSLCLCEGVGADGCCSHQE